MQTSVETRARIAFLIVMLLGVGAALAWYAIASTRYTTFEIRTRDAVSGLIADAPVEFHGVEVGKVERVDLADASSVRILLRVRKDAPVSTATVATITGRGLATRGFTGYVYVSLENAAAAGKPLSAPAGSPFPVIPTAASRSLNLDTAISQLNDNVQFMTDVLQSVLDPKTVAALKESLASLHEVTRTLASNSGQLSAIVANAQRASARFGPLLQSSDDAVRTLQTQVLPEARRTFARLDALASTQFEPLLQSSNDAVRVLRMQILPETYRTLAKLDEVSRSLGDVTAKIKQDPSIVVRGSSLPPPGPGETN